MPPESATEGVVTSIADGSRYEFDRGVSVPDDTSLRLRRRPKAGSQSVYPILVTDGNFTRNETGSGPWTVSYAQSGDAWYLDREISQGPVDDDVRYDHVAVQFVNVAADPHENLDFGFAGSSQDDVVVEPEDPVPGR